ncbi:MAG: hypothetical protein ABH846_02105, partial [Patescibacteria group bacterium]
VCDEQLVPKHLGCVVHPEFLQALKAGGAQKPRIKANDFGLISGLFKNPSARICEPCAHKVSVKINAGTEYAGQVKIGDQLMPFIIANGEYRAALERIGQSARQVARRILDGERLGKSQVREVDGRRETRCIVNQVDESGCLCGGWHNWRGMPAIVREVHGRKWAFAFGPACADAARTSVDFKMTYAEAIIALRQEHSGDLGEADESTDSRPKRQPKPQPRRQGTPDFVRDRLEFGGQDQRTQPKKGETPRGNHPETPEELALRQAENAKRREAAREQRRAATAARRAKRDQERSKHGKKASGDPGKKGKKKGKGGQKAA